MWMGEQGLNCPGCGLPREEVWPANARQARELQGRFKGEAVKCMACAAASEAQERFHSKPHDEHGIHWVIQDKYLELEVEELNG